MAKVHGKDTRILFAEFDLSNYFRSLDVTQETGLADKTAFTDAGVTMIPGLRAGTVELGGLFDGAADAVDEELAAAFRSASGQVVTLGIEGTLTVGSRLRLLSSRLADYTTTSPVTDVVQTAASLTADDEGIHGGVSLHTLTAETTTANGTSHDNTTSTSAGAVGHLHVTAIGGTPTLDAKIQHSADNSVWADLITFTQATGKTSQRVEAAGTVNRYLRAVWTIGGGSPSVTFAVGVARKR